MKVYTFVICQLIINESKDASVIETSHKDTDWWLQKI